VSVQVNSLPIVSITPSTTFVCVGSTASLAANGANTYTWNTGSTAGNIVVSPTTSTNYTVIGLSALGCFNSGTVAISVNTNSLTVSSNTTVCFGSNYTLTANGAITYTWNGVSLFLVNNKVL
jgi:hypothetical protein